MSTSTAEHTRPQRLWAFPAEPWILAALALTLSSLAYLFPASGDDWGWGTVVGSRRFHDGFEGYNGRWAGNLSVLFLTRVPLLTPIIVALTVCLLIRLLIQVAGVRTPAGYAAATALVLAMPLGEWRQTIVWVSGFSNYALGAFCMLVFIVCAQRDWGVGWRSAKAVAAVALPFAIASALFIEHVTVYLVLATVVNLVLLLRARRSAVVAGAWALGALVGAAVMFSNSAYRAVADGTSDYQSAGGSGLGSIIEQGTGGVSQYAVTGNTVLNVALLVAVATLVATSRVTASRVDRRHLVVLGCLLLTVALSAAVTRSVDRDNYFGDLTSWAWIPAGALLVALVLAATTLVQDTVRSRTILALVASAVVLIGPMAALNPYGPRNFLPPYLLLVAIALLFLAEITERGAAPLLPVAVVGTGAATVLVVLGGYFAVYSQIHHEDVERTNRIREIVDQGQKRIAVFELPHRGYVHNPDPSNRVDMLRFKRFHHLPRDLKIVVVPRG
ncbi:hypothetical protein ABIE44_001346 [Marmoricola sp. OAE513]|uniref:DUF6056 family protein n=1 Tax=Marmoricola sp. OAE513 TaxID=2817894 RepID=UPI001AEB6889